MSTEYPGNIDSPTNPTTANPLNDPDHAAMHSFENDAIVALETAVGITGDFNFVLADATYTGDLSGSVLDPTVTDINGSPLGTTTGASVGEGLIWNGSGWAKGVIGSGGPPSGAAGGSLAGSYPNPTIASTAVTPGTYLAANITVEADGRLTAATSGSVSAGTFSGNETTHVVSSSTGTYTLTAPGLYNIDDITLSANCTITGWAGATMGDVKDVIIRQKSSGGTYTYTVSWTGSTFHCPGGAKPTMSTGISAYDEYAITYDGTSFNLITIGQAFA